MRTSEILKQPRQADSRSLGRALPCSLAAMKEKQHYYYPAAPSPPPSPPPCLAPFPSLLPSSPAFCWPPPWAPQLAQSSSHLSPAGPLLPWKPTGPPVPTGSLESPAALTLSASLPCPGPASPLSACPPSLLFTLPLPWTSLWPWAGLQPPGQTAQLPLLPSHPVTSSPHLSTLGPACKPAQGPDIPTRGHLDLWELCESGTCWAQGAACAWPLRGSPVGPPVLQEALISPVSSQPRGGLARVSRWVPLLGIWPQAQET